MCNMFNNNTFSNVYKSFVWKIVFYVILYILYITVNTLKMFNVKQKRIFTHLFRPCAGNESSQPR